MRIKLKIILIFALLIFVFSINKSYASSDFTLEQIDFNVTLQENRFYESYRNLGYRCTQHDKYFI